MGTSHLTLISFIFIQCLTLSFLLPTALTFQFNLGGNRFGIGIGIGGPSPPPPSSGPKPSDFRSCFLYKSYYVIQKFKRTITCDPLGITNTWVGYDICSNKSYIGFYCEAPPGYADNAVASVDFNGYTLVAPSVEEFVQNLTELALFHANSNNFSGNVPFTSANTYFYELDLSNNKLSGLFPTNAINRNLTFLDLRFNMYYGSVPYRVFGDLPQAIAIFLNNNQFSGELPSNLGLSPVQYLSLANNFFTGSIPTSIVHATNLLEVLFLNNELSGCLPSEVGALKQLVVFDAGFNKITGPIPLSYGCLVKIEQLNLAYNLLYGQVPEVVCHLYYTGNLQNLSLSYNYFTWIGPTCKSLIEKGILDVTQNCIPGLPNQRSEHECWVFAEEPKTCPLHSYVPCQLPWGPGYGKIDSVSVPGEEKVPAVVGGRDRSRKSGYRTYGSLNAAPVP